MSGENAFLKFMHVCALTLALACGVFGAQCLAQNNSDSDEKAFMNLVKIGKCNDAFQSIWHRVATGDVKLTDLLADYIFRELIILDNLDKYNMSEQKISLMLEMKIFGRGSRANDDRLIHRLSSPKISQPGGKKVAMCLTASKGSGTAVQECIESAEAMGLIDDFMKFYFYADKSMDNAVTVQCGRK